MKLITLLPLAFALLMPPNAVADQTAPAGAATAPDPALTQRFTTFVTDVLAGSLPQTGVSSAVRSGFTPDLMAKVRADLAPLGAFEKLQFVSQDTVQSYQRYHYVGQFAKGTQALLFVLDSNGDIAGFFKG